MDTKYIVIKDGYGNETPIIFGSNFQHDIMAMNVVNDPRKDVISAGFVRIKDLESYKEYDSGICVKHELVASGQSISLNKKSRNEIDSKLLNYIFNGREPRE